jgi:hypothetical protein
MRLVGEIIGNEYKHRIHLIRIDRAGNIASDSGSRKEGKISSKEAKLTGRKL